MDAKLSAIGPEVAALLEGGEWRMALDKEDPFHVRLVGPNDGEGLTIYLTSAKPTRFEVSGKWPMTDDGRQIWPSSIYKNGNRASAPSITVAVERGAKALVSAIESRFLPEYRRLFKLCREQVDTDDAYRYKQKSNAERVAEAIGSHVEPRSGGSGAYSVIFPKIDGVYRLDCDATNVRFDRLSLPVDLAIEVLKLIQERSHGTRQDVSSNHG